MSVMTSQITGVLIVCSTVSSGADQRKHQSSASLAFERAVPSQRAINAKNGSIWWRHHKARHLRSVIQLQNLSDSLYLCHCYIEAMVGPYRSCQKPGSTVGKSKVKAIKDFLMHLPIRCRLGWQPIGSQLLKFWEAYMRFDMNFFSNPCLWIWLCWRDLDIILNFGRRHYFVIDIMKWFKSHSFAQTTSKRWCKWPKFTTRDDNHRSQYWYEKYICSQYSCKHERTCNSPVAPFTNMV